MIFALFVLEIASRLEGHFEELLFFLVLRNECGRQESIGGFLSIYSFTLKSLGLDRKEGCV